ncbi:MAG: cation:proton antiporter [Candidatus Margulisbacteria bacterium]|nr:cation:proton antiporter [Candidatus Margulisiibacteriota bacterium]
MLDSLEVIGIAILIGFIAGRFIVKIKIPAVAGYVIIGVVLGQSVLNIFHETMLEQVGVISDIALGFIAFIIGGELRWHHLRQLGKSIAFIVILESLGAFFLVTTLIQVFFHNWPLALVLGAVSAATAPAATVMVIREMKADGIFTRTLLSVVAIDDGIGLILYVIASSISRTIISNNITFSVKAIAFSALADIGSAIAIGLLAGFLIAPAVRRFHRTENILVVTIGALFIITGLADQLNISALLTNMAFGIYMTNFCPISSRKVFTVVKDVTPPIFIAFFVTAGAHLYIKLISKIWFMGLIYLLARIAGKIIGASIGANMAKANENIRKYIGFGLVSQVGVAIGLALVVGREFTPLGLTGKYIAQVTINLLLATTIFTEIIGPIMTRFALIKTGEAYKLK